MPQNEWHTQSIKALGGIDFVEYAISCSRYVRHGRGALQYDALRYGMVRGDRITVSYGSGMMLRYRGTIRRWILQISSGTADLPHLPQWTAVKLP